MHFSIEKSSKPGFAYPESYQIVLKTSSGETVLPITAGGCTNISLNELKDAKIIIPKLYGATLEIEDLYCISPAIYI